MTVNLEFGGTVVHSQSFTSTSLSTKTSTNITSSAVTSSTRNTQIRWNVKGKNGDNQRVAHVKLVLYFNQYTMTPHIGTNVQGVKSVNVSTSTPYQGDTVTFSAELVKGATWNGWYSDAACTNLVSTNRNYSFTASSDVTLYAKATISEAIYNCSAVAKEGVSLAVVSDNQVISGETCTFTATMQDHYTFVGWYMDEDCTVLVSNDNPYTTSIVSDTTFYAKGELVKYNVSVAQPQDGSASVSANQVSHGGSATFTCIVNNNNNREFYGWYKDAAHTQLVSPDATYVATITSDTTLYPLIGKTRYTKIIHPVKLFDALPYRGLVNGANPSYSIPADVSKITNIGLDQATSTVFAYQPHSTAIDFTHGMSIWFGANPIPEMPDNATIIGIQAKFGYSLGDSDYSSVKIGFGRFEYVSDNDETPITGSKSYAYTGENDEALPEDEVLLQSYLNANYLVNRASNFSNPMLNANTTYDLVIKSGTSIIQETVTVPINNPEEYPTSVANLKAGKLGFQINCKNKSTNASNRMLRLHAFDLYITYTIEDVSYKCDAISDGYTDVVIQSRDVAPGVENTWIARSIGGYRFDGWYSDPERTNLVSTQQEYVTTITAPLTLYAKSHYHSRVVSRVLDIPMGKGNTYFIGMDTNNNILSSETSGSGWKADFKASDYGWLSSIGGISDVVAAACMTNKSSTPYTIKAVLNTAAKDILFPNNTAHMVRLDSNAELGRAAISARLLSGRFKDPVNGNDYITPCFDGICGSVWRPNMIHNVNMVHTNIRHNWVLNVTKQSEIGYLMHQSSSSEWRAEVINNITLTGYFEEYDYAANITTNSRGVQNVNVNQAIGYEGDTIIFTANVSSYATFDGWYSDESGTQLVSTELNYSSVPDANLTLYAKASAPDGEIYTCQAVAKDNVATALVSEPDMLAGGSVTFTATINPHIRFLGWYSDESCTQLVSNQLSYTAIVNSNLTLYAKGEKIAYNINVGTAEHGSATVSKSTAYYGDTVTFNCTVDEGYEFKGWYSDEGLTQLISGEANYSHQVVNSIILYPKIELITYTIRIGNDKDTANGMVLILKGIVFYYDQLTKDEINYLRTGEYDKIDQSKIIETKNVNSTYAQEDVYITLNCPINAWIAVYSQPWQITLLGKSLWVYYYFTDQNKTDITAWPYYWYKPTENAIFHLKDFLEENSCICTAIGKEGIERAYATSPMCQGKQAIFEADVKSSYEFSGWYSDEACTTLVSTDNPAYVTTPTYTTVSASATSLTLYAKATTTAIVYNCSAVAGENVTSAAVSDNKVIEGGSVTFTATIPSYCVFDGWYTALTGGTKVSGDNPYTAIINSDTTLYARATKKLYTITLNQPDHGRATVSATTAYYDDQVTFTCYPDAGWQLSQWRQHYGSGGGWLQVSKSNPFVMTIQDNVVITPALTQINYNIRVGESEDGVASVSASTAHYGDNVVFTFTPNEGVDGNYGWYQDAELTQVVSRENPYVHTVTGNITLYPGVVQQISTGFYIKVSGIFVEAVAVYKKVNGAWEQQDDPTSLFNGSPSGTESNYLYLGE